MKKILLILFATISVAACGESICDADEEMCQVRVEYDDTCVGLSNNKLRYVVSGGCVADENLRSKEPTKIGGAATFNVGTGHQYSFGVGRASADGDEQIATLIADIPVGCTDTTIVLQCN